VLGASGDLGLDADLLQLALQEPAGVADVALALGSLL
jgi:hypothetical protein